MNKWFTVDEINEDTYIISECRHWEETHCCLLNGSGPRPCHQSIHFRKPLNKWSFRFLGAVRVSHFRSSCTRSKVYG